MQVGVDFVQNITLFEGFFLQAIVSDKKTKFSFANLITCSTVSTQLHMNLCMLFELFKT